jgi:hypothetical protein
MVLFVYYKFNDPFKNRYKLYFLFFLINISLVHTLHSQINPGASKADSLLSEGYSSFKNKDFNSALLYGKNSLSISQSMDYSAGSKNALLFLARVHKSQNKFTQTLDCYFQLLSEISQNDDEALKALTNYEIGLLYFDS